MDSVSESRFLVFFMEAASDLLPTERFRQKQYAGAAISHRRNRPLPRFSGAAFVFHKTQRCGFRLHCLKATLLLIFFAAHFWHPKPSPLSSVILRPYDPIHGPIVRILG
ncbi:hypothetical protein Nepgr_021868 [Nepenthes gracilis]|uniref:Uncharacterized protein n=1 Tax=Nepenthes gracilis TaxID=150966 RepID=A0AAD3T0T3_NEPGR|nr:hypothetical protein Nepgr_021868 [Nepenthes gracilis]